MLLKQTYTILTHTVPKNISQSIDNTLTKTIQSSIKKSKKEISTLIPFQINHIRYLWSCYNVWISIRINYKRNIDRRGRISAAKQTYGDHYTLNSRNSSKSSEIDGRFKGVTDAYSASTNYYN